MDCVEEQLQLHQSFPEPKHVIFVLKCHRFFVAKVKQSKLELMRQANAEFRARLTLISFKWHLLLPHSKCQNKLLFWCDQGFLWVKAKPGSTVRLHIVLHSEAQTGGTRRTEGRLNFWGRTPSLCSRHRLSDHTGSYFSLQLFSLSFADDFCHFKDWWCDYRKWLLLARSWSRTIAEGLLRSNQGSFSFIVASSAFLINHADAFQTRKMIWIRSNHDWRH